MIGLIFAAQLAAVVPASDSVELALSVEGSSEVPAQAYQVDAMVMQKAGQDAAGGSPDPLADVKQLEAGKREVCSFFGPLSFVGNEYYPPEEEPIEDVAAGPIVEGAEAAPPEDEAASPEDESFWEQNYGVPQRYTGLFATREDADRATGMLKTHKPTMLTTTPVLYECDEALQQAKIDALKRSQAQAQAMAEAMGMKVAGIVRIDDDEDNQAVIESLTRLYGGGAGEDERTVSTSARLRVTFKLVK